MTGAGAARGAAVCVTGIGVLVPGGPDLDAYWAAVCAGGTAIDRLDRFDVSRYPVTLAGQIRGFDAAAHLPGRLLPQTDVSTRYALVAADRALADAAVTPDTFDDYQMGVVTSNASGGFAFTHREFRKLWSQGPGTVSVYESFAWFYAVNTGQISIRNTLRGPSSALVAEQAGGLDALGHARRTIHGGTALMVTGGVDSALDPWGWLSQIASGRLSTATDPAHGYLPFDARANGYLPGEGGALLVLETEETARTRGAPRVYGEIAGYAATFDPPPPFVRGDPHPHVERGEAGDPGPDRGPGSHRPPGLRRAAELALADAGLTPDDIDVVFADAAGVPELDRAEAAAISGLFGPRAVPVTAPKTLTGRLYSGGGPVDVVCALLAIHHGVIPPTAGTAEVPEDYGLDVVTGAARPAPVTSALVLARGKWGFNSAVVVRAVAGSRRAAPVPASAASAPRSRT